MKATELRLGNLVINSSNETVIVREISETLVKTTPDDIHLISELKPIPLTEEILLKCGFLKCNFTENHYDIKGMRVWKCNSMFLCDKNGIHIKHLHQLQNLYFALCGEELEINL